MATLLVVATFSGVACGEDGDPGTSRTEDRSEAVAESDPPAAASAEDLESALAAARGLELAEAETRPEFERIETIHTLLGTQGFIETVRASARQRSGATYALDMQIVHRADEPAYRMTATIEQTGGQTEQMRQIVEMSPYSRVTLMSAPRAGGEFEQVRIGERYWERLAGEEWLSSKNPPVLLASEIQAHPPVAALSQAVDGANIFKNLEDPIGEEVVQGLTTTHYQLEGMLHFRPLWQALPMPGAPRAPPETPAKEAGPGTVDLWLTESGVVMRAELRLEMEQGDLYEATLELTELGEQPEIQPPD